MLKKKVLVYGWYHKNNIGDDLFVEAFRNLFPELDLTFVDKLTKFNVEGADAIFIGGGSFLYSEPQWEFGVFDLLKAKKVFYIGVGSETEIHDIHLPIMKAAKLIAIRNTAGLNLIKNINQNTILIPDIVYSLSSKIVYDHVDEKSVLILPNVTLVPNNNDPHWKFAAWEYFKSEFSQFLDILIERNYTLGFFSMCNNTKSCDAWATIEILNKMKYKDSKYILPEVSGIKKVSKVFATYQNVITQRFHGIILSEMMDIPYIALHHHDKLKADENNRGTFISYYNLSKQKLLEDFYLLNCKQNSFLPIECDMFEDLRKQVISFISG